MTADVTRPDPSGQPPEQFWNQLYDQLPADMPDPRVNTRLAEIAAELTPGLALDLGAGLGGDTMWLARRGWTVTAVDISGKALDSIDRRTAAEGLAGQVRTQQLDLATERPGGTYDLISAHYLHTLYEFPKADILRALSDQVNPGGLLLIVDHGSIAPWSWDQDAEIPTPEQTRAGITLDQTQWQTVICEARTRTATGPGGQTAEVTDNIIALRRTATDARP